MAILQKSSPMSTSTAIARLNHALPSVLLGTLFNVLDAVSTGLLIFPSEGTAFKSVQVQGMSMYILSTVFSQMAMTLRGSLFPGALGAMLIEILPFLRGIGSDLQRALGDDNPKLIPTVMVAYTLTSFLIGAAFILLGVFKAGKVVAYFPKTVLTGIIGGIGVSLFILGLELPLPASSPALKLSSVSTVLFGVEHLGLLAASCVPAFFLSYSIRSEFLRRRTSGATRHAYYVPLYFVAIPIIFWIIIAIMRKTNTQGMTVLVDNGWLFKIEDDGLHQQYPGPAWNYWALFDFNNVAFSALKSAITNIVLVVVIGVLNLPIYVPALGYSLRVPVSMNHEFIGQGVANLLAGCAGTVPNILQLSYSLFFTRAGGGRIEAGIVTGLTLGFFFISYLVLPYVPTVLASTLVLFLGIELTLEAVWESAKTLVLAEWLVVMTTLIACTFMGYAPGFGIGVAAAAVVYLFWGIMDTRARMTDLHEESGTIRYNDLSKEPETVVEVSEISSPAEIKRASIAAARPGNDIELQRWSSRAVPDNRDSFRGVFASEELRLGVIKLRGYIFFASIPSLESAIDMARKATIEYRYLLLDVTNVCRIETSMVEFLERKIREVAESTTVMLAGLSDDSTVYADLQRGGLVLNFETQSPQRPSNILVQVDPMAFQTLEEAVEWSNFHQHQVSDSRSLTVSVGSDDETTAIASEEDAIEAFSRICPNPDMFQNFFPPSTARDHTSSPKEHHHQFSPSRSTSVQVGHYQPGQSVRIQGPCLIFVLQGQISVQVPRVPPVSDLRPSLQALVKRLLHNSYYWLINRISVIKIKKDGKVLTKQSFGAGDSIGVLRPDADTSTDLSSSAHVSLFDITSDRDCWTMELHGGGEYSSWDACIGQWRPSAVYSC